MEDASWQQLIDDWRSLLGAFDEFAVHRRRPIGREGFALLLLRAERPVGFVKVRSFPAPGLVRERLAIETVCASGPKQFWTPEVLGAGSASGWEYLIMAPLPSRVHRVANGADFHGIAAAVSDALESGLPRPDGTPAKSIAVHGDFTPWNFREVRGRYVLFDWEDAGWAPDGVDLLWYDAVAASIGRGIKRSGSQPSPEARRFLLDKLDRQPLGDEHSTGVARSFIAYGVNE